MTDKQELFVREYLVDLNATQAAKRAGYSEKTAYSQGQRLLSNAEIKTAIQEASSERAERVKFSADDVLRRLIEIEERCMQARPVLNMKGEQIQDENGNYLWTFDARNALRALELIGRHLGMFRDKLELNAKEETNIIVRWEE